METYQRTYFTERGIAIRGANHKLAQRPGQGQIPVRTITEIDLFAGEMHYWRVHRRHWKPCLEAIKDIGLGVVSTYVPWGVHESRAGEFDWRAEHDLGGFLDLAAEVGLHAIVRPGPHINAQLTYFGFPERVLRRSELLAVSARDTPVWLPVPPRMFPVPSYASRVFQNEVATWFAAVGEVVASRLAPHGPVIAVQVDNEAQMFFRMGAYDLDYHPDALAWWRELGHAGRLDDDPPRAWSPDDAERCVRWARFKHEYTAQSLAWIGDALDQAGLTGVARFHNLPPSDPSGTDLPGAGAAVRGVTGMDFYHQTADYAVCRRRALYLVGSAEPLPFAPEVGMGGTPWLPPMSCEDSQNTLLALLSAGVRAFNLYMAVDRDRWYGAPIDPLGAPRPQAAWLRRLLRVLADLEWTSLRRHVPVALVWSRADAGFAIASSAVDPITPVVSEFLHLGAAEFALDDAAARHRRWLDACERALDLAQIPYDIVDEGCPADTLAKYQAVIAPTLERVDRGLWRVLHQVSSRGGKGRDVVVVIGPDKPSCDEYGLALGNDAPAPTRAGLIRRHSLDDINGLADDLASIAGDLPVEWSATDDDVDCALFANQEHQPTVLFVSNRSAEPLHATVTVPMGTTLSDALGDEIWHADDDGEIRVRLAPYQVRMLALIRTRTPVSATHDNQHER